MDPTPDTRSAAALAFPKPEPGRVMNASHVLLRYMPSDTDQWTDRLYADEEEAKAGIADLLARRVCIAEDIYISSIDELWMVYFGTVPDLTDLRPDIMKWLKSLGLFDEGDAFPAGPSDLPMDHNGEASPETA